MPKEQSNKDIPEKLATFGYYKTDMHIYASIRCRLKQSVGFGLCVSLFDQRIAEVMWFQHIP